MRSKLQSQYQLWFHKYLAMTQREQLLILGSGVILIVVVGYLLVIEPIGLNRTRLEQDIAAQQRQLGSLQMQSDLLSEELANDPNRRLAKTLLALQQKSGDLDLRLRQSMANLVPATQMPALLAELLSQSRNVKLVALQSIAPTPVLSNVKEASDINLYRHGVKLTLEGNYFDIQQYLQKIESLTWQFYWKKFDYKVAAYPKAVVEVQLYTLSTNQAFIGV
ncbi:MAG: MSHA biogenesis protein MshJ [Paraglaciecola sp.]|jgi:MSHA biogenesis protein MshJ